MKILPLSSLILRGAIPAALALSLCCPPDLLAQSAPQEHLVTPQLLQEQVESAAQTRWQNIRTVTGFLNTPTADRAMRDAHVDPVQVRTAIPTLSDQELESLASRAADAQQKFAAGSLSQGMLTLIIVLIAVIIIVAIIH
jgi:hypothetical protein